MLRQIGLGAVLLATSLTAYIPSHTLAAQAPPGQVHGDSAHAPVGVSPLLGWYHSGGPYRFERMAGYSRLGMNLIVVYYQPWADARELLARARQDGLTVLLEPNPSWMQTSNWNALRRNILAFRNNPALYGWYLADEPDLNGLAPNRLARAYRMVKSVDSRHPVAVVFAANLCRFSGYLNPGYLAGFDLLMFDYYPFYTNMTTPSDSLHGEDEFQDVAQNCVAVARRYHKRGPLMVLQAFGGQSNGAGSMWRDPTYSEESSMFRSALKAGAKGVLFFADGYADRQISSSISKIVRRWYLTRVGN